MSETNPRAVMGDNQSPDFAQQVTERMQRDFAELQTTVSELLAEAREAPPSVATDEEAL